MGNLTIMMSRFSFQIAIAAAFVVIIVGTMLMAGDALPTAVIGVMLGFAAMATFWAVMSMGLGGIPGLDLFYISRHRSNPLTTTVVDSQGGCPRGLTIGDRIDVDSEGNMSRSLCRTAVAALDHSTLEVGSATAFGCDCPLGA